ncbi:MAG: hypothetical protein QNJ63_24245 [Calothrix sp. MO_192.B10]|nr:hypothetical protein [Calothrix sp. MO_192.B10]
MAIRLCCRYRARGGMCWHSHILYGEHNRRHVRIFTVGARHPRFFSMPESECRRAHNPLLTQPGAIDRMSPCPQPIVDPARCD